MGAGDNPASTRFRGPRRTMRKRRATAVVSLALLAGCGTTTQEAPSAREAPPAVPAPPSPTEQVKSLALPFDRYELTQSQYNASQNATDVLIRQCMKRKGLDWEVIERPTRVADLTNRRRYGVVESKVARAYGYHAPIALRDPDGTKRADERRLRTLSAAQQKAALGQENGQGSGQESGQGNGDNQNQGTCNAKAAAQLDDAGGDYTLFNELSPKYLKDSQREPEVKKAMNEWSRCMKADGKDYATPYDAMNTKKWWQDATAQIGGAEERATAVRDVHCKEESGLVDIWYTAESALEKAAVKKHAKYFRMLEEGKERHLKAVEEVLSR
ncbi:hypothetical protein [Streptomyces sp. NPDC053560]|uniref:hypothetical protein n=1 Tax=Streptomyces sp. NPDC053560 TaxID=3365711 RepID=UPI0037CD3D7B